MRKIVPPGFESLESFHCYTFWIRHVMKAIKHGYNVVAFLLFLVSPFVRVDHTSVGIGQLASSNLFLCLLNRLIDENQFQVTVVLGKLNANERVEIPHPQPKSATFVPGDVMCL